MDGNAPRHGETARTALREARATRERVFGELQNLHARVQAEGSDGLNERIGNLNRAVASADDRISELEAAVGRQYENEAYLRQIAGDPRHFDGHQVETRQEESRRPERGSATGRCGRSSGTPTITWTGAAERVEQLVRRDEPSNLTSRYLVCGRRRALPVGMAEADGGPAAGRNRLSGEEVAAMQAVTAVEAERAMSIGSNAAGGFAVPYVLDPSIVASGNGVAGSAACDLAGGDDHDERVARSELGRRVGVVCRGGDCRGRTAPRPWRSRSCGRHSGASSFRSSIELGQDWGSLQSELVRMDAGRARRARQRAVLHRATAPRRRAGS